MRYSYCWDVEPRDLWVEADESERDSAGYIFEGPSGTGRVFTLNPFFRDAYVRVHSVCLDDARTYDRHETYDAIGKEPFGVDLKMSDTTRPLLNGEMVNMAGRFTLSPDDLTGPYVDVGASRFTGASIAGLLVGAMGVFVFTVALRHWLGERRRFREGARP
ncbi:MAG: hypothetical protein ACYTFI_07110 [Planctomycetota bacterium]|jgi:hypothetical protein